MNALAVLRHLFGALSHVAYVCARTRRMIAAAIARFETIVAMQRAAA